MSVPYTRRGLLAVRCTRCGAEAKAARTSREARQKARSAGWTRSKQPTGEGWRCPQCR